MQIIHLSQNLDEKTLYRINNVSDANVRTLATKTAIAMCCIKTSLTNIEHSFIARKYRQTKQASFNVINHCINALIRD
jgi:hypothetical protein